MWPDPLPFLKEGYKTCVKHLPEFVPEDKYIEKEDGTEL